MRTLLIVMLVLLVTMAGTPAAEAAGTLYVDDDGVCAGNSPCYLHPQDAVNAANPRDTCLLYPSPSPRD